MSFSSIGDMRQHFLGVRNNASLRNDLGTLVQELTTGTAADMTAHLGVNQTSLASVDRRLQIVDRFVQTNTETGQMLSMMQTALAGIEAHRGIASGALLTIGESSSEAQIQDAAAISASGFDSTVQSLNLRYGSRALFGGNDFDATPMASSEVMMDGLKAITTGLTSSDDVKDAVDAWFDTPSGGFETIGYQGSIDGYVQRGTDDGQSIEIGVRADDSAIRDTLKAFAIGALASETSISLSLSERQELQNQSGLNLLTAASPFVSVQARLGYVQSQVEAASVRTSAQKSSLNIARNDLVSVDPFDTATKLDQVQLQLETHYTLTARLSRLSLTEYLR